MTPPKLRKPRKSVTLSEIRKVSAYKDQGLKRWEIACRCKISYNRVQSILAHYYHADTRA